MSVLPKQYHPASRRVLVEGDNPLATCSFRRPLDQRVGEIGLRRFEEPQRLPGRLGVFHDQLPTAEDRSQNLGNIRPGRSVATLTNPDDLNQDNMRDEAGR
jgi:hypothetical protein